MKARKSRHRTEYGDFQTPTSLATRICDFLFEQGVRPASIVEPTCGEGNFLLTALDRFGSATRTIGVDINPDYIKHTEKRLNAQRYADKVSLFHDDFFAVEWGGLLTAMPEPILVVGNPPWVTSSQLSTLDSANLPKKSNFQGYSGLDALTGKSNFDISEWMLIHILEFLDHRDATLAMLCKMSVARKVLSYAWKRRLSLKRSRILLIDAKQEFDASVNACLLFCDLSRDEGGDQVCSVYGDISTDTYQSTFGYRNGRLVANIEYYERWNHLEQQSPYRWRSGIKHDCSKVMELEKLEGGYRNKLGELFDLETTYVYPMLKSSDVARERIPTPTRWMIVTQGIIGEDTASIEQKAPKTWAYLISHSQWFDRRRSAIYRGQPRFSLFGVGEYSFSPWKVAISGLYKKLHFAIVGPYAGKPVVLDDTCYFIPCQSEEEARFLAELLNSKVAKEFFEAFVFWDAKRPITVDVLNRLDLVGLARELGAERRLLEFLPLDASSSPQRQLSLFGSGWSNRGDTSIHEPIVTS